MAQLTQLTSLTLSRVDLHNATPLELAPPGPGCAPPTPLHRPNGAPDWPGTMACLAAALAPLASLEFLACDVPCPAMQQSSGIGTGDDCPAVLLAAVGGLGRLRVLRLPCVCPSTVADLRGLAGAPRGPGWAGLGCCGTSGTARSMQEGTRALARAHVRMCVCARGGGGASSSGLGRVGVGRPSGRQWAVLAGWACAQPWEKPGRLPGVLQIAERNNA